MRLVDAEKVSRADILDLLLLETKYGSRGIFAEDLAKSMLSLAGQDGSDDGSARNAYFELLDGVADVAMRKNTFRGKYLGNEITEEQYTAIEDGSFKDFFVGDYWRINGYTWRIADFDYWWDTGDYLGVICKDHHLVIMPDEILYSAQIKNTASGDFENNQNSTNDGYANMDIRKTGLNQAKTIINSVFGGNHILNHKETLCNLVTNGIGSGHSAYDSTIEIPNECMIYGAYIQSTDKTTLDKTQLMLFVLRADMIPNGSSYALRDVSSETNFAYVTGEGSAFHGAVTAIYGIRPVFGLY